jgi:SAM-dependent methyltransferase
MLDQINFKGHKFPAFQATGNAARFIIPFAVEVCRGFGVDVGCNRAEWALPGAFPIDPALEGVNMEFVDGSTVIHEEWHATQFPNFPRKLDFIFSSHCLEHIENPWSALDYWHSQLTLGGILFLYLPDISQVYWRPWHNRKHIHCLTPEILRAYLVDKGFQKIHISGIDLNNSFAVIAER